MKNTFGGEKIICFDRTMRKASENLTDFDLRSRGLNSEAVYDFLLYNIVLPPNSLYEGIEILFPGQEFPSLENREYRELARDTKTVVASAGSFARRLDKILGDYFAETIARDKPVALMLSGGIDSAIIGSYLPKDTVCVTWGGWGEKTTDVTYSRKTFERFGFAKHLVIVADYDRDDAIYKKALRETGQLFSFTSGIPHLRMSQRLEEHFGAGTPYQLFMGQNADTISGAYLATEHVYYWPKVNRLWQWLPFWKKLSSRNRKWFLPSTTNPVELMAFFHSCAIFPGPWIDVPAEYFDKKQKQIEEQIGRRISRFRDHILMHELMTEARRNQYVQNNLPPLYGAAVNAPYYHKEVVKLFMEVPFWVRMQGQFDKEVLKELARLRGVPDEVIAKGKKGLSYGFVEYIKQGRHLAVWNAMEKNEKLNKFVDIRMIRKKLQDNFPTFDLLMSLHYHFQTVWNMS